MGTCYSQYWNPHEIAYEEIPLAEEAIFEPPPSAFESSVPIPHADPDAHEDQQSLHREIEDYEFVVPEQIPNISKPRRRYPFRRFFR